MLSSLLDPVAISFSWRRKYEFRLPPEVGVQVGFEPFDVDRVNVLRRVGLDLDRYFYGVSVLVETPVNVPEGLGAVNLAGHDHGVVPHRVVAGKANSDPVVSVVNFFHVDLIIFRLQTSNFVLKLNAQYRALNTTKVRKFAVVPK